MARIQRLQSILIRPIILSISLLVTTNIAFSYDVSLDIPENAHPKKYGSGWKCDRGFQALNETCIAINVPKNGYLTNLFYGSGWDCDRGFRAVNDTCVAINVPENGYLTNSSNGAGWECDRGFRAADETCEAVAVPENVHLDYSGYRWECNQSYVRHNDECIWP